MNPDISSKKAAVKATGGAFTVGVTGLSPNTLYHFRGYAANAGGTSYTADSTFTTGPLAPNATVPTAPNAGGFTANWTAPAGTADVTYRLDVAVDSLFTDFIPGYDNLSVSDTSAPVTGLISGKTYYYRVRAVNDAGVSLDSNTMKTVFVAPPPPPTISLSAPAGGNWYIGAKCPITWSYTGTPGPVRIDLLNNGFKVSTIVASTAAGSNGTGSYNWTIPKTEGYWSEYQIKVSSTTDVSCTSTSDSFTISAPTITITSPSDDSSWDAGANCPITWSYAGSPGPIRIDLLSGGFKVSTIVASKAVGSNGTGSYNWTIPINEQLGGGYQIRVTSTTISSCSNTSGGFTVAGPTITVTSPSSGSIWNAGAKCRITWNYTGNPGPFRIDLWNEVSDVSTIASSVKGSNGTGSYSWAIPERESTGAYYYVQITSTGNPAIYGVSAMFSITAATASAGPDQKVGGSAWVRLSGSNSIFSPKETVSYRWTQHDGPPVAIGDPSAVETGFVAPDAGLEGKSLGFQLTVTGREGAASRDNCIVNAVGDNAPPVADAGPNQAVAVSQIVELDGSRSSTVDAGPLSYSWRQVSGVPVSLSDASTAQCTFVAPEADAAGESLVFELTVTDQAGLRSRDTCIVNVVSGTVLRQPGQERTGPYPPVTRSSSMGQPQRMRTGE